MADARKRTHDGAQLIGLVWRLVRDGVFERDDFVITGSARLLATGYRKRLSDIDVVARGDTWRRTLELVRFGKGYTETTAVSGATVVRLCEGMVEVCDHWFMPGSDTDSLIERAEGIGGLLYMSLQDMTAYKEHLDRPKDRADLALLKRRARPAAAALPTCALPERRDRLVGV